MGGFKSLPLMTLPEKSVMPVYLSVMRKTKGRVTMKSTGGGPPNLVLMSPAIENKGDSKGMLGITFFIHFKSYFAYCEMW